MMWKALWLKVILETKMQAKGNIYLTSEQGSVGSADKAIRIFNASEQTDDEAKDVNKVTVDAENGDVYLEGVSTQIASVAQPEGVMKLASVKAKEIINITDNGSVKLLGDVVTSDGENGSTTITAKNKIYQTYDNTKDSGNSALKTNTAVLRSVNGIDLGSKANELANVYFANTDTDGTEDTAVKIGNSGSKALKMQDINDAGNKDGNIRIHNYKGGSGNDVVVDADGLQAKGSVEIINDEQGVVINGAVDALNGYIQVTSEKDITNNNGAMTAKTYINMNAKNNITNTGALMAGTDTVLHAGSSIDNQGAITSTTGKAELTADTGKVNNTKAITADTDVTLKGLY
ncbi:MAG: hypothetical protein LKE29_02725 [Acidaminococcaceae bacterium]|nr:hypothetical protein [Acidaminococcaceae bacterium]